MPQTAPMMWNILFVNFMFMNIILMNNLYFKKNFN